MGRNKLVKKGWNQGKNLPLSGRSHAHFLGLVEEVVRTS